MTAYFVTATGTDIGKTFVTAGLVRYLRDAGVKATALKPVVSGFDAATAQASDPALLLEAQGIAVTPEALDAMSPWRFAAPLSPDMAAAREGRAIDFERLVSFCRNAMRECSGPLFIEGVGGVMVPLDGTHTVLDWMKLLDVPLVLIAGSYLGTVSHTLTALEVLRAARLKLRALVVNESSNGSVPIAETVATLKRFVGDMTIVPMPRVKEWSDAQEALASLVQCL